ncbi:hypothetical protein BP6252_11884 [Coleophoma cylindrospora]|uniref:Uncharacterized protein n=1 Tax=Coleophoma cylindrospora TaxID=1849047 RepID=A0A3D8QL63_9HELO|nr:hypothetical protein BP6252_11884 [Coleophoma cylindrospora]
MDMWKGTDEAARPQKRPSKAVRTFFRGIITLAFLYWIARDFMSSWNYYVSLTTHPFATAEEKFSWSSIEPTTYLNYTPCFGKFQCARLDVPKNYNSTDPDGSRTQIAVIRLPAVVPVTDPRYGGAMLTNPGGPGGSGVELVTNSGALLQQIIDSELNITLEATDSEAKYFDIISWDPRGTGDTTPYLNCFPDSLSYNIWSSQTTEDGFPGSSSGATSNLWARVKARSVACSQTDEIVNHMNTPVLVGDMVQILEKHGEWRSKQAETWLASAEGKVATAGKARSDNLSHGAIVERTRWIKGEEKLLYWGFSYGTVVGSTFSAMQPHRVDRVIIDGVVDTNDYYVAGWLKNLQDADTIVDRFYGYCQAAGPEKCALNRGTSTATDIKTSLESTVSVLKEDPIAVPASSTRGPEIITYSDVRNLVGKAIYSPLAQFPKMANLLADIIYGNGSAFADYKQKGNTKFCPLESCKSESDDCQRISLNFEVTHAILCSDAVDVTYHTKQDYVDYVAALFNQSQWLGQYWSQIALGCYHWKAKPTWQITGEEIQADTAYPVLILSNTFDPVTPIYKELTKYSGHTQAGKFPGAVVLEQNSEGHCSLSSPSLCTAKHVRAYFQTGKLPDVGTVCQPEAVPLVGKVSNGVVTLSTEDEKLLAALEDLSRGVLFPSIL